MRCHKKRPTITCAECSGIGRVMAPAVKQIDGYILPQAWVQCAACGGAKSLPLPPLRPNDEREEIVL